MTTPRIRPVVSLAAALAVSLTLAGCASAPSRFALDQAGTLDAAAPAPHHVAATRAEAPSPAIRFDNEAPDFVRVYLVDDQQRWLLGRVEAGARASLRVPAAALAGHVGTVRLSVLRGTRSSTDAAASTTVIAGPMTALLSQRWAFSQTLVGGELTWLPLERGDVPHR